MKSKKRLHCCCCLSTTKSLLYPAKIEREIYKILLAENQALVQNFVPWPYMFCLDCCKKLTEFSNFQVTCQNSAKFIIDNDFLKVYSDRVIEIETSVKDLMMENVVKTEEKVEDDDFPMDDGFDHNSSDMENDELSEIQPLIKIEVSTLDSNFVEEIEATEAIPTRAKTEKKVTTKKQNKSKAPKKETTETYCSECDFTYPDQRILDSKIPTFKRHVIKEHSIQSPNGWTCKICQKKLRNHDTLITHFRWIHLTEEGQEAKCELCDNIYQNSATLKRHIKSYHERKIEIFQCDLCSKSFKQKTNLIKHMKRHVIEFTCICKAIFYNKEEYRSHKKVCTEMHMCHICGTKLQTKSSLENHVIGQHLPPPPCTICGKEFQRKQDLDHHHVIEHTEKTFVCDLCGKKFHSQNGLDCHIKFTHLKIKNEYAKKKFWCEICQKWEFRQVMVEHKQKAELGRRFKCELCERAFFCPKDLKKHMYSHTKTRPFNCKLCEIGYYCKKYLKGHYERVHGCEYLGEIRK